MGEQLLVQNACIVFITPTHNIFWPTKTDTWHMYQFSILLTTGGNKDMYSNKVLGILFFSVEGLWPQKVWEPQA